MLAVKVKVRGRDYMIHILETVLRTGMASGNEGKGNLSHFIGVFFFSTGNNNGSGNVSDNHLNVSCGPRAVLGVLCLFFSLNPAAAQRGKCWTLGMAFTEKKTEARRRSRA